MMAAMATARLGIPYAHAARFAAPDLLAFDADAGGATFGPSAPQESESPLGRMVPGMGVGETDEDACLTLNVWTPDTPGPHPVLVWFHGGSFVIGGSGQAIYDGALLADEQSVVVVTANYRLGAFGFLDARNIGGVANCGVRDAIAALQWVHDNIAQFGGDRERVVTFGESGGGGLILHALASPAIEGLLAGAIVQSGATFATLDEQRAGVVFDALVAEAGTGDLRALSADDLVAAQSRAMSSLLGTIGMMPFHPVVDGELIMQPPPAGLAVDVPLVVGTTADEMALFVDGADIERERLEKRVARYLRVDDGAAVVDAYARELGTESTGAIWRAIFGDNEMQVPCRAMCEAHKPVWTYCFTWEGPNIGACHGIDIPFPFGNFVDGWDTFVGLNDDGRALSRAMREAWAAFARTGDPGWPQYPAARIFGREQVTAPAHPLFVRLPGS
jgi:para-nitrobenzyl esterase